MKLRLAFGLLATVAPRLLVLDEVLAVGDTAFRAKCLERIRAMRVGGTSLVLASHAVHELDAVCDRAVWLHRGAIRMAGPLGDVVAAYERAMHEAMLAATPVGAGTRDGHGQTELIMGDTRFGSQAASIAAVTVGDTPLAAGDTVELDAGAPLRLAIAVTGGAHARDGLIVSVCVRDEHGTAVLDLHDAEPGLSVGPGRPALQCELELERLDLRDGDYTIDLGVYGPDWEEVLDFHFSAYRLRVRGADSKAMLVPPHRWRRG